MDELISFLIERKELFERLIDRSIKSNNQTELNRCFGARSEIDVALAQIGIIRGRK